MIKKILLFSFLFRACLLPALAPTGQEVGSHHGHAKTIVLDAALTILQGPDEPEAVRLATQSLAGDFEAALGTRPAVIDRKENASPVTILVGEWSKIPEPLRPSSLAGAESFSISVQTANWNSQHPTKVVVLAGADIRGTMYAIYQFSEKYLGIDPLYYWTDRQPERRASIEIPASLNERFPSPLFKYRGFFINDEDLLTGWAPGELKDKTGISLSVWDKIFETICG